MKAKKQITALRGKLETYQAAMGKFKSTTEGTTVYISPESKLVRPVGVTGSLASQAGEGDHVFAISTFITGLGCRVGAYEDPSIPRISVVQALGNALSYIEREQQKAGYPFYQRFYPGIQFGAVEIQKHCTAAKKLLSHPRIMEDLELQNKAFEILSYQIIPDIIRIENQQKGFAFNKGITVKANENPTKATSYLLETEKKCASDPSTKCDTEKMVQCLLDIMDYRPLYEVKGTEPKLKRKLTPKELLQPQEKEDWRQTTLEGGERTDSFEHLRIELQIVLTTFIRTYPNIVQALGEERFKEFIGEFVEKALTHREEQSKYTEWAWERVYREKLPACFDKNSIDQEKFNSREDNSYRVDVLKGNLCASIFDPKCSVVVAAESVIMHKQELEERTRAGLTGLTESCRTISSVMPKSEEQKTEVALFFKQFNGMCSDIPLYQLKDEHHRHILTMLKGLIEDPGNLTAEQLAQVLNYAAALKTPIIKYSSDGLLKEVINLSVDKLHDMLLREELSPDLVITNLYAESLPDLLGRKIKKLEEHTSTVNSSLTAIMEGVKANQGQLKELEGQYSSIQQEIQGLFSKINSLEQQTSTLKEKNTQIKGEIDKFKEEKKKIKEDIKVVENSNSILHTLEQEHESSKLDISRRKQDLETKRDKLIALPKSQDPTTDALLEEEIKTLKKKITDLELEAQEIDNRAAKVAEAIANNTQKAHELEEKLSTCTIGIKKCKRALKDNKIEIKEIKKQISQKLEELSGESKGIYEKIVVLKDKIHVEVMEGLEKVKKPDLSSQHLKRVERNMLSTLGQTDEIEGKRQYNLVENLLAANPASNTELIEQLSIRAVVEADLTTKSINVKPNTEKDGQGNVQIMAEHNHEKDHSGTVQSLMDKISSKEIGQNTVIALERKQYGERQGMKDVIMLANILAHNEKNPDNKINLPEKIENTPLYNDALLYKLARENGIKVIGLEGKDLKTSQHSPDYNKHREEYMAGAINNITKKGYNIIVSVGSSHVPTIQSAITNAQNTAKVDRQPALTANNLVPKNIVNVFRENLNQIRLNNQPHHYNSPPKVDSTRGVNSR